MNGDKSNRSNMKRSNEDDADDSDDASETVRKKASVCCVNSCCSDANNSNNSSNLELNACPCETATGNSSNNPDNVQNKRFPINTIIDASEPNRVNASSTLLSESIPNSIGSSPSTKECFKNEENKEEENVSSPCSIHASRAKAEPIKFLRPSVADLNFEGSSFSRQESRLGPDYFSSELDERRREDEESEDGGVITFSRPARFSHSTSLLLSRKLAAIVPRPCSRLEILIEKSNEQRNEDMLKNLMYILDILLPSYTPEVTEEKSQRLKIVIDSKNKSKPSKKNPSFFTNDKKLDLSQCDSAVRKAPTYPGGSGNKVQGTYRFSTGDSNNGSGSQPNYSTNMNNSGPHGYRVPRPGFSSLLRNVSSVDLSPFRSGPPIRFRLGTTPRMTPRKTQDKSASSGSQSSSVASPQIEESPQKEEDDVDLYSDIEQDAQEDDEDKNFGTLEPPPEPPAMLMGLSVSGDDGTDEEEGLVIDDKEADIYDPAEPCDDSNDAPNVVNNGADEAVNLGKSSSGYLHSPTYNDIVAEQAAHDDRMGNRSIGKAAESSAFDGAAKMMEPPPFPPELLSKEILTRKEKEDDEECPNFSLYSSASMNLVKNSMGNMDVLDIPIPGQHSLDMPIPDIPSLGIPTPNLPSLDIPIPGSLSLDIPIPGPPSLDIPIPTTPRISSIPVPVGDPRSKQSKSKKKKKKKKKLVYSVPTLEESILKERLGNYSSDDESDSDKLDEPMEDSEIGKRKKGNESSKKRDRAARKHENAVKEKTIKEKTADNFNDVIGKEKKEIEKIVEVEEEEEEEEKEEEKDGEEKENLEYDGEEESITDETLEDKVEEKEKEKDETESKIASESDSNLESSMDSMSVKPQVDEPAVEENQEAVSSADANSDSPKLPDDKSETCKISIPGVEAKEKLYDGEDESSIQGDVLDIEAEANLQDAHSIPDEQDEIKNSTPRKTNIEKSDGLVDITDEEMSEYDHSREADAEKLNSLNTEAISEDEGSIVDVNKESEQSACLALPGLEGLQTDPISDSDGNAFDESNYSADKESEYDAAKKRKKKKKVQKEKEHSTSEIDEASAPKVKEVRNSVDFEEGEIVDDKPKATSKKDKKKKAKEKETKENLDRSKSDHEKDKDKDKRQKKGKDTKTKDKDSVLQSSENKNVDENKEKSPSVSGAADVSWKKLSKSTKDRNYRDGKTKSTNEKGKKSQDTSAPKEKEKKKEKRRELERYNVRKVLGDKVKLIGKDDFGRDLSLNRSMSRSRSRSKSRSRNRGKGRARSRSRSRSPRRSPVRSRALRSRSRSRSRRRLANRKRSRSKNRSVRRSYGRSRSKSRGHSKEKSRKKKASPKGRLRRSPSKDRTAKKKKKVTEKKRVRSISPEYSPARKRRSTSRYSWSPTWSSYSLSPSPRYSRSYSLSPSPSWTPDRSLVYNRDKNRQPKNITVIVPNADANAKKKAKKRLSKKNKENERRRKKRDRTPAPSKEVFTSGDNILVSVNFSNNKNDGTLGSLLHTNEYPTVRRRSIELEPPPKKSKQDKNKDKKSKSSAPKKSRSARTVAVNEAAKNAKPIAVIDLNMSPFREETPSPKEIILVTDSDLEGEILENDEGVRQTGSARELGQPTSVSQPESPINDFMNTSAGGPKTPPEPRIAFSISSKQPQIRTMINPLMDGEEEEQLEEASNETDMNEIFSKGPNTPPEPPPDTNTPASPPTTPYDPFDPTKSRSPSPELGEQTSTPANLRDGNKSFDTLSPSAIQSSDLDSRNKSSPQVSDENKNTPENLRLLQKESIPILDSPKQSPPIVNVGGDGNDGVVSKILGQAKIDFTCYKSPEHIAGTPRSSQLTPKAAAASKPSISIISRTPANASKMPVYTPSITLNGEKLDEAPMDISGDSPYSPEPYEAEDLFEPPAISPPRVASKLPMPPIIRSSLTKANKSKFDALFGTMPRKPATKQLKPLPYTPKAIIPSLKGTKPQKTAKGKGGKKEVGVKMDEDQLKILDDLPSSAVEMQVKDKYLKKLNRQERVVEEVKLVLKPHYAKKHITKDDYKEILRRAVPKVCHNKSGEINPMKIQSLIEAYVRKFRAKMSKKKGGADNEKNLVTNNPSKRTKATRS